MIKNRLLDIRLNLGYRFQNEFADYLNMQQQDYNKIENNRKQASLKTALKIAKKLNLHVDDVFYDDEDLSD